MQYRRFGQLDWEVSVLGFGTMRLPRRSRDLADVDQPEAIRMIRYAIDHGANYVDTGYLYHAGQGERVVGLALKDGYRSKIKLAAKLPARLIQGAQDFDSIFNEQLQRLGVSKVDFYLMHGLSKQLWTKVRDLGVLRWAEGKIANGQVDHLGFSFHDEFHVFKEIIDAYDNWTLCQVQYNYMDVNRQAGRRGVEYAASRGLAVVVMEPVRGGQLSKDPAEPVAKAWGSARFDRSLAEWALAWVWNQPEISVALSGMSNMEQVVENVAAADHATPGMLTAADLAVIDRVREAYHSLSPIPCTGCRYCMPCPNGVEIPVVFQIFNDVTAYREPRIGRLRYLSARGLSPDQRADRCRECRQCVEACPQKLDIPTWLKKAHAALTAR